jgi:Ca2+-binding RTX toxin-like protein
MSMVGEWGGNMATTTISTLQTTGLSLANDDLLIITETGELKTTGPAITWTVETFGPGLQIVNRGDIASTNGVAINTGGNANLQSKLQLVNLGDLSGDVRVQSGGQVDFTDIAGSNVYGSILTGAGNDSFALSGRFSGSILANDGNDRFILSGSAIVSGLLDGGSGRDALAIDHSGVLADYARAEISADPVSGFAGFVFATSVIGSNFAGIEDLSVKLAPGGYTVSLDAAPLLSGATLVLRGGGGEQQRLAADFSDFNGVEFALQPNGEIFSNYGTFSGFGSFALQLGSGSNRIVTGPGNDAVVAGSGFNVISTGEGGDFVKSVGGVDTIDAGGQPSFGFSSDQWLGDYSGSTVGLNVQISQNQITLSNGSLLKGFERADITLGSGDDSIYISPTNVANLSVAAGLGHDSILVDLSRGQFAQNYNTIRSTIDGTFSGSFINNNPVYFSGVEDVTFKGGMNEVFLAVDAGSIASGGRLDLDGGTGASALAIDFSKLGATRFIIDANGAIDSNHGSFSSWETVNIKVGDDNNVIQTGIGNDVVDTGLGTNSIRTGNGDDVILTRGVAIVDGGAGNDSWNGQFDNSNSALNVTLLQDGASIDNGSLIKGVESVSIVGGNGDVSFIATGNIGTGWYFEGGSGLDTLEIDRSGIRDGGLFTSIGNSQYASGGYSSLFFQAGLNGQSFEGVEKVKINAGNDVDVIFFDVNASDLDPSARFEFDGGGGRDAVSFQGSRQGYLVELVQAGQYRILDIDPLDGDNGSLLVSNVERILFTDQEIRLNYYDRTVNGTDVDDVLTGGATDDAMFGLEGNDFLVGGKGDDYFDGGSGNDTASYSASDRGVLVNLALNVAQFTGEGRDVLKDIENLTGSAYADGLRGDGGANILDGALGNDNLFGFGGADVLIGGEGVDRLDGGDGADVLRGGFGRDVLTGGADADTFVFDTFTGTPQPDTIRDFAADQDKIAISQSVFTAFVSDPLGALSASAFHVGTKATSEDHHLIYNSATGALFYDADGLGGAAQIQIAQLTARPIIDASDFILI